MSTLLKACLSTTLLLSLSVPGVTLAGASASVITYNVDGTKITVLVPEGMHVNIVPERLTTEDGRLAIRYTFTTWEKEVTYALEWRALFSDPEGNITLERQWGEWGEWAAGSVVSEKALFDCPKTPGTRLTIVVEKVLSDAFTKSCEVKVTGGILKKVLFEGDASAFRTEAVRNVPISAEVERALLARSLKKISEMDSLNRDLGVKPEEKDAQYYYLSRDGYDLPANLSVFRPLTQDMLTEKFETGQAVRYFEYGGHSTMGDVVELLINYHTPSISRNYKVAKGVHLTFTYRDIRGRFEFRGIKTRHF